MQTTDACEGTAALPPAVPVEGPGGAPGWTFSEVMDELSAVAALAGATADPEMLVAACLRAQRLVRALREQFRDDLGIARAS